MLEANIPTTFQYEQPEDESTTSHKKKWKIFLISTVGLVWNMIVNYVVARSLADRNSVIAITLGMAGRDCWSDISTPAPDFGSI